MYTCTISYTSSFGSYSMSCAWTGRYLPFTAQCYQISYVRGVVSTHPAMRLHNSSLTSFLLLASVVEEETSSRGHREEQGHTQCCLALQAATTPSLRRRTLGRRNATVEVSTPTLKLWNDMAKRFEKSCFFYQQSKSMTAFSWKKTSFIY